MKDKYEIIIGSPIDYNELVAYIWLNGEQIALLQKEEGSENIIIEFFGEPISETIYLSLFLEAINDAKSELLK